MSDWLAEACADLDAHDRAQFAAGAKKALTIAKELIDDGLDAGVSNAYSNGYCDANQMMRGEIDDLLSSLGAQEKDHGAGLIHQTIPDVAETEPRPNESLERLREANQRMRDFIEQNDEKLPAICPWCEHVIDHCRVVPCDVHAHLVGCAQMPATEHSAEQVSAAQKSHSQTIDQPRQEQEKER